MRRNLTLILHLALQACYEPVDEFNPGRESGVEPRVLRALGLACTQSRPSTTCNTHFRSKKSCRKSCAWRSLSIDELVDDSWPCHVSKA